MTIDQASAHSLVAGGEIRINPDELSDAQWFMRDALPPVPPPLSIARQLIDAWLGVTHSK